MSNKHAWTLDDLQAAVESSRTYNDVYKKLGYGKISHETQKMIKRFMAKLKIDVPNPLEKAALEHIKPPRYTTEELLVENSPVSGIHFKNRLIREGLLKYECYECNISSWRDKKLVLQLDHINGKRTDNRLKNLRLLCPNCHSQTETFAGKNKHLEQKGRKLSYCSCGNAKDYRSTSCNSCSKGGRKKKWPLMEDLMIRVKLNGLKNTAESLNVEPKLVVKKLTKNGFDLKAYLNT